MGDPMRGVFPEGLKLTIELVRDNISINIDPGSFGERAQSRSERIGSCFFRGGAR
jgi:hypothetical protein